MAPTYKLHYFNISSLGEPIRLLLHYGKIPFEDYRIPYDETWKENKKNYPMEKVPVLEVDGKFINQSSCICRYVAKTIGGLTGDSLLDEIQADVAVNTVFDLIPNYFSIFMAENDEIRKKNQEELKNVHHAFFLGKFNETVGKNGGYFVNGKLTWADIFFVALDDFMKFAAGYDAIADWPHLKALREKVQALPGIKEYLAQRPKIVWFTKRKDL